MVYVRKWPCHVKSFGEIRIWSVLMDLLISDYDTFYKNVIYICVEVYDW